MRALCLACSLGLLLSTASAQTPGSCALGMAQADLDVSDVFARVFNTGSLFYGGTTTNGDGYLVPRASGNSPIFAAGLWVGGTVGGELRVSAARYNNFVFRPGPLNVDGSLPNPTNCSAYDRIWSVRQADIDDYNATGTATPDLADWPVALGADVVDGDGVPGNYNLAGGDRPRLYGTQNVFWVMNDVGGPRTGGATPPIGLEVQVTGAAIASADPALNQATLYRYRLIKRSPGTLDAARVGIFMDSDLGSAIDDYVGSDIARGMAYTYNENDADTVYGDAPPAIGMDVLTGASAHMYFTNTSGATGDPSTPVGYYNFLLGLWGDGSTMRAFSDGYQETQGEVTTWAYPGDPVTDAFWSERNINGNGTANTPNDRRSLLVAAPFALQPNVPVDIVVALPFARGSSHLDSVTRLRAASDVIQSAYDSGLLFPVAGEPSAPGAPEALALTAPRPNPTTGAAEVTLTLPAAGAARVTVLDALGRTVAVVHDGALSAGAQAIALPAGLAPGVYTVAAEAAGTRVTQRLTVVR